MDNIEVSVITPFYYGNEFIYRLAASINRSVSALQYQGDGADVEWIIVNDSPGERVGELPDSEGLHVRIVSNDRNEGIHASRVHGLSEAHGDYIVMIDQDDEIAADYLSVMLRTARSCPDAEAVVCNELVEEADGGVHKLYPRSSDLRRVTDFGYYLNVTNPIQTPGQCLIKSEAIPDAWKKRVISANGSDDLLLWLMMLTRGARFQAIPHCLVIHHHTGGNLSDSGAMITQSSYEVAEILLQEGFTEAGQDRQLRRSISLGYAPRWRKALNLKALAIKIGYRARAAFSDEL